MSGYFTLVTLKIRSISCIIVHCMFHFLVYNKIYYFVFQGCNEFISPFVDHPPSWSAFRSTDYGYTRLKVFNSTHLYFEQVSDNKVQLLLNLYCEYKAHLFVVFKIDCSLFQNGEVIDKAWIIKEIHGSYS